MSYKLSDGVTTEEIKDHALQEFWKCFDCFPKGFVRFQPSGQVLPRCFMRFEKELNEFKVNDDDVFVSSFPKCGTTWTQEMVWNIVNDLNFQVAKSVDLEKRVPFLELSGLMEDNFNDFYEEAVSDAKKYNSSIELAESIPSPRIIKTHLSFDMLPRQVMEKQVKLIYVARNPRDACVSYYHHWKIMEGFRGSFDTFFNAFIGDVCGYCTPFLGHVLGYWENRDKNNILFITYEEMKQDLQGVVRKTSKFLNKSLSESQVSLLVDHLSFKNMKKNNMVNKDSLIEKLQSANATSEPVGFMRKGQTGDWKTVLTKEQVDRIIEWEKSYLEGTDLQFVYEI